MAHPEKASEQRFGSVPFMPQFDFTSMLSANRRGLRAAHEAQSHMLRRMAEMNDELYQFADRRMQANRAAAEKLSECKSLPEVWGVCGTFVETAVQQYSEEMGLLAGVCADQAREAAQDIQEQVEEVIEPVLEEAEAASAELQKAKGAKG